MCLSADLFSGWLVSLFVLRQDTGISIYALRSNSFLLIAHKVPWDVLNNYHPFKTEFYLLNFIYSVT